MIKFNHSGTNIREAFCVDAENANNIDNIFKMVNRKAALPSWIVQRFWLDETLSDNAKCYAIFMCGTFIERANHKQAFEKTLEKFFRDELTRPKKRKRKWFKRGGDK